MDLTNKLCSVPVVYHAMYFFRKMIGFQLLVWENGHTKLRTNEVLARLFHWNPGTETMGFYLFASHKISVLSGTCDIECTQSH